MRTKVLAVLVSVFLLGPAMAAPICKTVAGEAAKCGTENAMPLGWTPSPAQQRARKEAAHPNTKAAVAAIAWIALLLALIALMPDFQGRDKWDWDRQEDDRS